MLPGVDKSLLKTAGKREIKPTRQRYKSPYIKHNHGKKARTQSEGPSCLRARMGLFLRDQGPGCQNFKY